MNNNRARVLFLAVAAVLVLSFVSGAAAKDAFPAKPIRIINYVAPGGLMDVTTRKFTDVASKYTKAVFVVENRSGAGGLVGMEYVLGQPADGYTIFAPTTSVVIQVVSTNSSIDKYVWGFEWVSMLMKDPECIISNSKLPINDWADIVKDAKAKGGKQIWVGPSTGGNDHLMAMKVWDKAGISAMWIPFESGPKAMAALMGGQGVAYVGNPADTMGRPDLKVCAVSSDKRLKHPTLLHSGIGAGRPGGRVHVEDSRSRRARRLRPSHGCRSWWIRLQMIPSGRASLKSRPLRSWHTGTTSSPVREEGLGRRSEILQAVRHNQVVPSDRRDRCGVVLLMGRRIGAGYPAPHRSMYRAAHLGSCPKKPDEAIRGKDHSRYCSGSCGSAGVYLDPWLSKHELCWRRCRTGAQGVGRPVGGTGHSKTCSRVQREGFA